MSEGTTIEWCDFTVNVWRGCSKVSPGCKNCYAEKIDGRNLTGDGRHWGPGVPRRDQRKYAWKEALRLNRKAEREGRRFSVFNSMNDWLDDEVPIEWLADLLDLVRVTPHLDWLLLTKRPENFEGRLYDAGSYACTTLNSIQLWMWVTGWLGNEKVPENVWIGTSVEDQKRADERIPELLKIPAKLRFLSCEPLLERVELLIDGECSDWACPECGSSNLDPDRHSDDGSWWQCFDCNQWEFGDADWISKIHWVICGGESGPGSRKFDIQWARLLRDECRQSGVAFFMKQVGERPVESIAGFGGVPGVTEFNLRFSIEDKKGGDMSEWPEDLRVREMPRRTSNIEQGTSNVEGSGEEGGV